MSKKPPRIAIFILKAFLPYYVGISALGDYEEVYSRIFKEKGNLRAGIWLWLQIIKSILPFLFHSLYWSCTMIHNYLTIALRNIKKHFVYSIINISGLAVGMACCIVILFWVQDELNYDKFHDNADHIYRIISTAEGSWTATSPWAIGPVLKNNFPEITRSTRFNNRTFLTNFEDMTFNESVALVDPDFFEIFTFPFIKGDPNTALSLLNSVVITEEIADKYFRDMDPLGKVLKVNNDQNLTVTGVIKNVPSNSSLQFQMIVPVRLAGEDRIRTWFQETAVFVLLQKNCSVDDLRSKISKTTMTYDQRVANRNIVNDLQPMLRIHLHDLNGVGNILYVYVFSFVAVITMLIACVNFINLTTARASNRAKEIGLRKVVGAVRNNIIGQFFGESLLLSFIALLFALILVYLFMPSFNALAEKQLTLNPMRNVWVILGSIMIVCFTGVLSGSYPALFVSSFKPVDIFRNSIQTRFKNMNLRNVLVVLQFVFSVVLIICTFIIGKQLSFIRNMDPGFSREQIITLRVRDRAVQGKVNTIKEELKKHPNISQVSVSDYLPNNITSWNSFDLPGRTSEDRFVFYINIVDYDYIDLFDIDVVEGRNFSHQFPSDKNGAVLVNETAVESLGWDTPLQETIHHWDGKDAKVVGVVKDFHLHSLHHDIKPMYMYLNPDIARSLISLKTMGGNIAETIEFLENTMKKFSPSYPFEYSFFDESFERAYRSEKRLAKIFKVFSLVIVFVACMGLIGLAAFSAQRRTKEIAVRKTFGASIKAIILLISKDFIKLVLYANIFSWPFAWYFMNKWLETFAYRSGINAWMFLIPGIASVLIAVFTVSFQAVKAAVANPVDSLRNE